MNTQSDGNRNANFLNPLFDKEKREAALRKKEYERNLQLKEEILEKEFEKQLLQEGLEEDDTQENLVKLRGFLDNIAGSNQRKMKDLTQIYDQIENMDKQEKQLNRSSSLRMGTSKDSRLAPSIISAKPYDIHEYKEREIQMEEKQQNIEELQKKEEQIQMTLKNKFDILYNDNIILKERIYELLRALGHAADRYRDLAPAEFTAKTLEALTMLNLNQTSKKVQEIQEKDEYLRKTISEYHREASEKLAQSKTKMSDVLVKIDQYHKLYEQQERKIEELENYHIRLQEQKINSRQLNGTIEVLEQLEKDYIFSKHCLRPENDDQSQLSSNYVQESESTQHLDSKDTTARTSSGNSAEEVEALMQTLDKNHFLFKIHEFSLNHKGGVQLLADRLIEIYRNMSHKEISLKSQYEELSRQKNRKSAELTALKSTVKRFQAKNHDDSLENELNSSVSESDMKSKLGIGFVPVNGSVSTVNQVNAGGVSKANVSALLDQTEEKQTAAINIYSGIIEMLLKFTSLVSKIEAHNSDSISNELKIIAKDTQNLIKNLREAKKSDSLNSMKEILPEKISENKEASRVHSLMELDAESENMNPEKVTSLFLKYFEGSHQQAIHFSTILQNDQFIKNFVSPKAINEYLSQQYSSCISKEEAVNGALEETTDLVSEGSKILLQRIEVLANKYIEFIQEISYNYQGCITDLS